MDSDREEAVRARAYALWETEGHPAGKAVEHWLRAEAEIGGLCDGKPAEPPAKARPAPRRRKPAA